jgi:hypothetical protein
VFDRVGDGLTDFIVVLPASIPGGGGFDIVWLDGLCHIFLLQKKWSQFERGLTNN